jgi:hypothetical protein
MYFKLVPTGNSPIITYFQITTYFYVLRFSYSICVLNWSGIIEIFQTGLGLTSLYPLRSNIYTLIKMVCFLYTDTIVCC